MTRNKKIFGIICGIGAAICYGTNPLGALKLYEQGMSTSNVLVMRFSLAWIIIAVVMLFRKESLRVTLKEFLALSSLGLLFVASSLTLYLSFHKMAAGVASTILFVYPVMTAIIMALFFHEKPSWSTVLAIVLSFLGVLLLYWSDNGATLSTIGIILVLISALTYALYIIVMNRAKLNMSSFKINFYVLIYCSLGNLAYGLLAGESIMMPSNGVSWFYVLWLAVVPAILALTMMIYAAKYIGSTPTAILGALEPLTAVLIGIFIFSEPCTLNLFAGIVFILLAVIIIALQNNKVKQ